MSSLLVCQARRHIEFVEAILFLSDTKNGLKQHEKSLTCLMNGSTSIEVGTELR